MRGWRGALTTAAFVAGSVAAGAQTPATITPDEAARHVGQVVTVQGVVTAVTVSGKSNTTFINFGPAFPNQTLAGVIFSSAQSRFPNVEKLVGKTVLMKGTVKLYRGKPEIILERGEQLLVVV